MKKVAILAMLALELAVCGCNNIPLNAVTTTTNGNWEALLSGGTGAASELNFTINFTVSNTTGENAQGLSIYGFSFINSEACFLTGVRATGQGGSATITTLSTGQVTGTMSLTISSLAPSGTTQAGNILQLTADPSSGGGVSGMSNGTTSTSGTLSNGVVWGVWALTGNPACTGGASQVEGTFIMCQNAATCTIP